MLAQLSLRSSELLHLLMLETGDGGEVFIRSRSISERHGVTESRVDCASVPLPEDCSMKVVCVRTARVTVQFHLKAVFFS
jgi:hypothetical protein